MKAQPSSKTAEKAVLGSCIINPVLIDRVEGWIQEPNAFYYKDHEIVWTIILGMWKRRETIDTVTIVARIKEIHKTMITPAYYVTGMIDSVPSTANAEAYAKIVWEKYIQREVIKGARQLETMSYDDFGKVEEVLMKHKSRIIELEMMQPSQSKDIDSILMEAEDSIKTRGNMIPFGIEALDEPAGGMTRGEISILGGRPGHGKCFRIGTKILMSDGKMKTIEDVNIGDFVMGINSQPRKVLSLGNGTENMYDIVPISQGLEIWTCNESHILSLVCSANMNKKYRKNKVYNISINEYKSLPIRIQQKLKQYKVGVDFPERTLPIDPYFLGLWIGDGSSDNSAITTADKEIVEYLSNLASKTVAELSIYKIKNNKANLYRIVRPKYDKPIHTELRNIGVLNNKHIPYIYKINSRENRLQLLAGYIDSDGYLIKPNNYEISSIKEILIDDILYVIRSLGFSGKKYTRYKKVNGEKYVVYYASIAGNLSEIPVKIPRKKLPPRKQIKNPLRTGINIINKGIGKYYGFELDGDGLFLLGDFTVTHNTTMVVSIVKSIINQGYKLVLFNREMSNIEFMKKLITLESNYLYYGNVRSGDLSNKEAEELPSILKRIKDKYTDNLFMYDTIRDVNQAMREIRKHNPDVVVDDYIQLIDVNKKVDGRRFEIENILTEYKWLAKEKYMSCLLVSQLSRDIEKRIDPRPKLSDYAESGVIEQVCENAFFVFYGYHFDPENDDYGEYKSEIISAKARYGKPGRFDIGFNGGRCKFYATEQAALIDRVGEQKF